MRGAVRPPACAPLIQQRFCMISNVNIQSRCRIRNILYEASGENENAGERTIESRSFKRASSHVRAPHDATRWRPRDGAQRDAARRDAALRHATRRDAAQCDAIEPCLNVLPSSVLSHSCFLRSACFIDFAVRCDATSYERGQPYRILASPV